MDEVLSWKGRLRFAFFLARAREHRPLRSETGQANGQVDFLSYWQRGPETYLVQTSAIRIHEPCLRCMDSFFRVWGPVGRVQQMKEKERMAPATPCLDLIRILAEALAN